MLVVDAGTIRSIIIMARRRVETVARNFMIKV
jgi:hypothetical protein